jgi:hypothetical protein
MKKSTIHYGVRAAAYPQRVRAEIIDRGERGSISVETVVIALGLFALATLIIGLLTSWATGRLGGLG